MYTDGVYFVHVKFVDGKSREEFWARSDEKRILINDIEAILEEQAPASETWKREKNPVGKENEAKFWKLADKATAAYLVGHKGLVIEATDNQASKLKKPKK